MQTLLEIFYNFCKLLPWKKGMGWKQKQLRPENRTMKTNKILNHLDKEYLQWMLAKLKKNTSINTDVIEPRAGNTLQVLFPMSRRQIKQRFEQMI